MKSGSMTVEAAVTVPVFLLVFAMILGVVDLYRVQSLVKTSLHQSALELGMYAYAADTGETSPIGVVSAAAGAAYAKSRLPTFGKHVQITMTGTTCSREEIDLIARIRYRLPIALFPVPPLHLVNESKVSCWIGGNGKILSGGADGSGEMVYVSDYESVYHTHADCTHLDLSVHAGSEALTARKRNAYGEKYHACERCTAKGAKGNVVYYTEKGNRFHTDENCSGLKRSVRLVEKTELSGLRPCSRCQAKEDS